MHRVLLLGAGKIGSAITKFLLHSGDYEICVADVLQESLDRLHASCPGVSTIVLDVSEEDTLRKTLQGYDSVFSALSYRFNPTVAKVALEVGCSYFDLTEDVESTRVIKKMADNAQEGQIFMPQCGLAPGFVGIVAHALAQKLDTIHKVIMRVGALPLFPSNALKYNLTWSTDGLINEYCNACEAIHDGEKMEVLPLEGLEYFSVDGVRYEAFNTSGGLGTLCDTLEGKAKIINYKTVRYPGHRDLAHFLLSDLKLRNDRALLKEILEKAIPMTLQDVVLVFCSVTGEKEGKLTQITDARKVYHGTIHGEEWSAIQITTAAGACAALDLHATGELPRSGFVSQEQVSLEQFLSNRFGHYYEINNTTDIQVTSVNAVIEGE